MIVDCKNDKNERKVFCKEESTLTKKLEYEFSKVSVENHQDVKKVFYDVIRWPR